MNSILQFPTFFVGLWPLIKANVAYMGIISACVVFAIYSPRGKTWAITIAVAIAVSLFSYNRGVNDEYNRMEAQRVVREEQFNKELAEARRKAVATVARRATGARSGWLRNKPQVDQYDRNP